MGEEGLWMSVRGMLALAAILIFRADLTETATRVAVPWFAAATPISGAIVAGGQYDKHCAVLGVRCEERRRSC